LDFSFLSPSISPIASHFEIAVSFQFFISHMLTPEVIEVLKKGGTFLYSLFFVEKRGRNKDPL
jgi:hypothetical protein